MGALVGDVTVSISVTDLNLSGTNGTFVDGGVVAGSLNIRGNIIDTGAADSRDTG